MIYNFFKEKERIEQYFDDKKLGIFGRYITTNANLNYIDKNLSKIKNFEFTSANIFYLYISYVIRGDIIFDYINNCEKHFFDKNLMNYYDFDRYFFERDFPNILTRYGYDFKYDIINHHPIWNINSKNKIRLFSDIRFNKNLINIIYIYCLE